jgi:hypothetical protein
MHFHDIEFFFNQKRERHGIVATPHPGGGAFLAFLTYSLIIPLVTGERDDALRDVVPLVTLCSGAKGRNWTESVLNN